MTDHPVERSRAWLRRACIAAAVLLVVLVASLLWRVEWSARSTAPQPWALINDGALTFGAGELAGGPGRPGWLISFSPPSAMDVNLVPFLRMRDGMFLARLPFWIPFAIATLLAAHTWRRVRTLRRGLCARCHYDLTGITSSRCPECGHQNQPRAIL